MAETVTKRLHVGGLTPSITPDHLRDRFRSFGTVTDVEGMGLDAVGQQRPFAFLTIETTPAQLRKCLNIMSGAMWRGTQLRIAEAKPRWDAKLVSERIPVAREARRANNRLRRAVAREGGRHAQDMRVVTAASKSKSKFWVDDNGHLIRPLSMRPDRPLLPLPRTDAHAAPPARAYRRVIDPRRWGAAHLAGAEMDAGEVEAADAALGEWEFIDADGDEQEDEEGRTLVGWWRRGDDEVAVRLRRPRADGEDEFDVDDVSDLFPAREGSPLFPGREDSPLFPAHAESPLFPARGESPLFPAREGEAETRGSSPLFPSRDPEASSPLFPARPAGAPTDAESTTSPLFPARDLASSAPASTDSSSPLFPARLLPSRVAELVDDDEMMRSSRATTPSPSPTRIFEVSRAMSLEPVLRKLVTPEASHPPSSGATSDAQLSESSCESPAESPSNSEPTPEPTIDAEDHAPAPTRQALDIPDAVRAAVAAERTKDLGVLASLLGASDAPTRARAEFVGFAEDDSDDGDYSALRPVADAAADDDDVPLEVARASAPSPDTPRYTTFEHDDEPMDADEDEDIADVAPVHVDLPPMDNSDSSDSDTGSDSETVDADNKPAANGAGESSSSGSSSSSSGSSDSGSSDAAAPNGAGGARDGGSGSSGSSDSGDSDSGSDDDSDSSDSGSDDDDDDDDSDSSDSDSDSDSSDSDSSDSDSDSSDSDDSDDSDSDTNPAAPAPAVTTLKDMFTTTPTTFSLGALAPDLELDDTLDVPLPTADEPELALLAPAPKSTFDADAGVPLFFPLPVRAARRGEARSVFTDVGEEEEGEREGEGEGEVYGQGYGHGDAPGDAGHAGQGYGRAHAGPSGQAPPKRGLWADETDADMKRRWEARRLELTRGWKRKHREAVKHRRRRGGDDAE